MSLISSAHTYIIDSSKRISGTPEHFSYRVNIPNDHVYDRAVVLAATIPKSFYMITAPSNTFILTEGSTSVTVTVPPGNTNVVAWIPIITTLLNIASPNKFAYSLSYPDDTTEMDDGRFMYKVTGSGSIQPTITFPVGSKLFEQFGFTIASTNQFVSNYLKSTCVIKFQQENILYIHSDICTMSTGDDTCDVLQEIYASSTAPFSDITYQATCAEAYSKAITNPSYNSFTFYISDEHSLPIFLNGLEWSLTILIYKKDDINEIIAGDILVNKTKPSLEQ